MSVSDTLQNDKGQRRALKSLLDGSAPAMAAKQDSTLAPGALGPGTVERGMAATLADLFGISVKQRGAAGDGATDDTAVLNAMLAAGGDIFLPPGTYYYSTKLSLVSNTRLWAIPGTATLKWTGSGSTSTSSPTIELREASVIASPFTFSVNVEINGIRFECVNKRAITILAVNVRGLKVRDCEFYNCGGLRVAHEVHINGTYSITSGGGASDPAVLAGFSSSNLDDLNEDIRFVNNKVNGVTYNATMACRLDFTRRFVVSGNICKYASISWWGGAASNDAGGYGGLKSYLRRICQGTIVNNYVSWSNGGIYGNNGACLAIAGNTVEYIIDTGIDLEGCMNCSVSGNTVRYCGNYCYSTFYNGSGNVFSGNTGVQGPAAAGLNAIAGTGSYGPNLGRTLFKQTTAFAETPLNDARLEGNTFTWDSPTGFGVIELGGYTNSAIVGNTLRNVVVDGRLNNKTEGVQFERNQIHITNTIPAAYAVIVALAAREASNQNVIARNNEFYISSDIATTIPLLAMTDAFNGLTVVAIEGNVVQAGNVTYSIAFGDMRTRTGTPPKQAFMIARNIINAGTIRDLGIITATATGGYTPNVVDSSNYTAALAASAVNVTPDTSLYASMAFGTAVS